MTTYIPEFNGLPPPCSGASCSGTVSGENEITSGPVGRAPEGEGEEAKGMGEYERGWIVQDKDVLSIQHVWPGVVGTLR